MKIVSLLLVLAMLLSFAACSTDPVNPADTDDATESTTPEDSTTADAMDIQTGEDYYSVSDYLPTETFGGEDIHIWIDDGTYAFYNLTEEQFVEGDIVHEAVQERNAAVEEGYDVVLNWNRECNGSYRSKPVFRQSVLAGDEYDLVGGPAQDLNALIPNGCFYDLSDNEYIDFSKPWWIEEATANQRVYDRQFTAVGYFDFQTIARINVFFFNGKMVDDYNFGNMYDLVTEGNWTWEKMMEMSEIVSADVNQDGVMDESDRYGLAGRWDYWTGEVSTCGYQYVSRDANGEYVITGVTDDLLEINAKVYPVINNSDVYYSHYTYGVHTSASSERATQTRTMFCNNQILFLLDSLARTSKDDLRSFGAYGVLPSPKYLEGQEDYASSSSAYISAICSTTGDLKISSIILEALQIESYNILRPVYTKQALSYKYLTDPQAVSMLNLIFREVCTQWGENFSGAGLGQELFISMPTQQYLGSYFQENASRIQQQLEDLLVTIEALT